MNKTTDTTFDAAPEVLKVRLSLMGRPIKVCTFQNDVVTVGRDPDSDLHLDNPGISRHHCRLERAPEGYYVHDLESANGTFLNDEPVRRALLRSEDVVRVGKFSLWVSYERARGPRPDSKPASTNTFQGTTVLSTTELDDMMARSRERDTFPVAPRPVPAPKRSRDRTPVLIALMFVLGIALGVAGTWFVVH